MQSFTSQSVQWVTLTFDLALSETLN